jgi:hypothetical protein
MKAYSNTLTSQPQIYKKERLNEERKIEPVFAHRRLSSDALIWNNIPDINRFEMASALANSIREQALREVPLKYLANSSSNLLYTIAPIMVEIARI